MSNMRSVKQIIPAFKVNMGGIYLDQALPNNLMDQVDPFMLVHHLDMDFEPGTNQKHAGVGPHPHRGFAPVSFIFKGAVHHRDSMRFSSVVEAGGTQFMYAGKGIIHSERPSEQVAQEGKTMELIQWWMNVPAAKKMDKPYYQAIHLDNTPTFYSKDGLASIAVVAGEQFGLKGPMKAITELIALRFELKKGAQVELEIPSNLNAFIYQLDGKLKISEVETKSKDMTVMNNDGGRLSLEAMDDTRAMLLAGEPIKENVVSYGPFVMNTHSEIMAAMRDYQMGKMGVLIEDFD